MERDKVFRVLYAKQVIESLHRQRARIHQDRSRILTQYHNELEANREAQVRNEERLGAAYQTLENAIDNEDDGLSSESSRRSTPHRATSATVSTDDYFKGPDTGDNQVARARAEYQYPSAVTSSTAVAAPANTQGESEAESEPREGQGDSSVEVVASPNKDKSNRTRKAEPDAKPAAKVTTRLVREKRSKKKRRTR